MKSVILLRSLYGRYRRRIYLRRALHKRLSIKRSSHCQSDYTCRRYYAKRVAFPETIIVSTGTG